MSTRRAFLVHAGALLAALLPVGWLAWAADRSAATKPLVLWVTSADPRIRASHLSYRGFLVPDEYADEIMAHLANFPCLTERL